MLGRFCPRHVLGIASTEGEIYPLGIHVGGFLGVVGSSDFIGMCYPLIRLDPLRTGSVVRCLNVTIVDRGK